MLLNQHLPTNYLKIKCYYGRKLTIAGQIHKSIIIMTPDYRQFERRSLLLEKLC
jgi:hypothetical protein